MNAISLHSCNDYKMNEIVNRFLLAGDKFMPEMQLKQPGFTCSTCGPFTSKEEVQIIFPRMILIELVFSITWLVVNTKT